MTVSDADLSRAVSHALRHEPWRYELELDEEGWASVDQLVTALRETGGDWSSVDRAALERMIATASKQRHEIDGDRIRALYGHSTPKAVVKRPSAPPAQLFHGTAAESMDRIQQVGLLPMGRQFVHLSTDRKTARLVGSRKTSGPVVLVVDAAAAAAAGVRFYRGNDIVWLADNVPPDFIELDG